MALADFPHCSEVIYEEECALGGNFKCAYFDKNSRTLFLISGCDVVSFDPRNGTRKDVYHHDGKVIGLSFDGDLMSIYTREPPQVVLWHLETKDKVLCKETRIPVGYQPLYFYEVSAKHYLCAVDTRTVGNGQEDEAFLFQVCFDKAHPANKWQNVKIKQICGIGKRPATEKCLAVGNGFYVKSEGKTVKLVEFAKDGASESDEDDDEDSLEEAKKRQFTLESHFNVSRPDLVAFTEISISGDCLYATVNVGRVYVWSRFLELGIGPRNCSQLTLTGHQTTVSISNHGSMFVATGNGVLFKYNAEGASGVGRWHRLSHLQLDSPPFALALSADSTMLAIIFVDNSVCTVQTAEMKLVASMETLNTAQTRESDYCFDILNDPADTGLLVQNARLGRIQWVDPFRWKTTNKMDVAEEHLPHQDTFNRPNFLWLNPYLAHLTLLRVVTCECRRNEPQTTFLKFWRRATAVSDQSIEPKLEDCFSLSGRISFIRSTLDGSQNVDQISAEKEEFLLVYSTGDLDVYQRDPERSGRWRLDTTRRMLNWQRSRVRSCSTIRGDLFAAVNSLGESTSAVVVWKLEEMEVVRILEELASPNQAEWAPQPNVLLITCASGLVAFDNSSGNFLWAIIQSDITAISSTSIATFAHNGQDVFVIDAESGLLKKEGLLRFSRQQKRIIALERQGNVCFAGMDSEGSLSLTTPIISIAEEPPKQAEEIKEEVKEKRKKTKHKTAFSQLLKNGEQGQQNGGGEEKEENGHGSAEDVEMRNSSPPPSQPLMNKVSLRKLLDGPAYSLPHISQLAEQYVQSCLTKRHK